MNPNRPLHWTCILLASVPRWPPSRLEGVLLRIKRAVAEPARSWSWPGLFLHFVWRPWDQVFPSSPGLVWVAEARSALLLLRRECWQASHTGFSLESRYPQECGTVVVTQLQFWTEVSCFFLQLLNSLYSGCTNLAHALRALYNSFDTYGSDLTCPKY